MPTASPASLASPQPRVWVTRAATDAGPWVQGLSDRGMQAQSLPLMALGPAADLPAVQAAWTGLAQYHAVMFVSANAVRYFFQSRPATQGRVAPWGAARAWVTGMGSRAALLAAGMLATAIDAPPPDAPQWDSEALWAVIATQIRPGQQVLIVRGADAQGQIAGRDWLRSQLQAAGVQVAQVAAYQRLVPTLTTAQRAAAAQAARDGSVWLFSNAEAVAHLTAALPGQDWSQALAVATHPRIAQQAQAAGWGHVVIAPPALDSVASSIKSVYEFRTPRA